VYVFSAISGIVVSLPAYAALHAQDGGSRQDTFFLVAALASEVTLGAWVWIWVHLRHRLGLQKLGVRRGPGNFKAGLLGALAGLAASYIAGNIVLRIADQLIRGPVEEPKQLPTAQGAAQVILSILIVVVAAPIAEELFFRGFLYQAFRRWRGVPQGTLLSAFVFALAHVSPIIMPSIFALGVILAYLFERRGSLAANISAHMVYNLIGFILIVATGS